MLEEFRLRIRHEPKRGPVWELLLVPVARGGSFYRELPRCLSSASSPTSIAWLRSVLVTYCKKSVPKSGLNGFGPGAEPLVMDPEEGMRLALAFSCARYLAPQQQKVFAERLYELAPEVLLYWFTQCFYGNRTAAARAALRELLTHDGDEIVRPSSRPAPALPEALHRKGAGRESAPAGEDNPDVESGGRQ